MKTNKILVAFVIIFFLTTVVGVSYIVYNEFFNTSSSSEEEINNENTPNNLASEEELDVNSRLVQSLYNKVVLNEDSAHKYFMYDDNDNYIVNEASEESRLTLAYNNLKNKDIGYVNTANLPETTVVPAYSYSSYGMPYHSLNSGDVPGMGNDYVSFFSYDDLVLAYKDLFGSDALFTKETPIKTDSYGVLYYIYNESLDGYVPYITEGGGTSSFNYTSEITKALKTNNQILIYEEVSTVPLNSNNTISESSTYIYTFNIDDDGMYSFVSRVKE